MFPNLLNATERLTDVVDFPTPPFPEATASIDSTPGKVRFFVGLSFGGFALLAWGGRSEV